MIPILKSSTAAIAANLNFPNTRKSYYPALTLDPHHASSRHAVTHVSDPHDSKIDDVRNLVSKADYLRRGWKDAFVIAMMIENVVRMM